MVTNEKKKMSPRDILKLQKIFEKKAKKSRRAEFLRLFYSNPQRLLKLIKNLHEENTICQQIKVNIYLQTETACELCFLVELCKLYNESVVKVIGTRLLTTEVRFQENNEFIKRLKKSEGITQLVNELLDKNLEKEITSVLEDFSLLKRVKCYFVPIYHPYRKNLILYACLIYDVSVSPNEEYIHGIVGECFRYCQEIIVNTMRYNEQKEFHEKQKRILQMGIDNLEMIDDFSIFLPSIRQHIIEILNAERCNIFLLDGKTLVSRIYDHGISYDTFRKDINNVIIPVGKGIIGAVAQAGEAINCIDAKNHPLYLECLDIAAGLVTRNLICFPLMLYGRVFGVVEAVNKRNGYLFSEHDLSHCQNLGDILGIQLYMSLMKKKNLEDYSRRMLMDNFMLKTEKDIEENEINLLLNCKNEHVYAGFGEYMFIPTSIPQNHIVCVCLYIFEATEVLQKLDIDRRAFGRFLLNVKNRQKEFSFHGWQHAFNTLHFIYTIVKREKILESGIISTMECFCMLVAALCHDMEYGGPVTPFMPTSGTTLGSLYSSPGSVVQIHSIAQTVRLLADSKITDEFDFEMFKEFLSLLDKMVIDLDLGNHVYNRGAVKKLIEGKMLFRSEQNRRHYFALLLTCSDVSDFCKPWQYFETQGAKISNEFFTKGNTTDCQGLIEFSELFENVKLKKIKLQIHFLQNICEPAFSLLSSVFPRTDRCMETIEYNTRTLQAKQDKLIQEQLEHE